MKIKIYVNVFFLSGIETLRVKPGYELLELPGFGSYLDTFSRAINFDSTAFVSCFALVKRSDCENLFVCSDYT